MSSASSRTEKKSRVSLGEHLWRLTFALFVYALTMCTTPRIKQSRKPY